MYPAVLSIVFEQFVENQLFRRFYYVGIFPTLHKSVRYKPSENWSSEKLRKGKCMRKGQNVYKRKDGRWEARIITGRTAEGKILYKSLYAPTCRQALQRKKDYEIEMVIHPLVVASPVTFYEASLKWISENSADWKHSTRMKYQNYLERYIIPEWGYRTITEIDEELYKNLILQLKNSLSESSIQTVNTILKNCLAQVPGSLHIVPKQKKIKDNAKQIEVLTNSESAVLVHSCMNSRDTTALGILIALFEGIRLGELCALRWRDIDTEEGVLHIRHTLQRVQNLPEQVAKLGKTRLLLDTPKNHKERTIPIHPQLRSWLEVKKKLHSDADFVLSGSLKPVEPRTMTSRFKKFCETHGLRDFKFHTLRHTFATRCVESGMDIKVLSELLGHSSVKITLDRYVHPSMEYKKFQISSLCMS